MSEPFTIFLGMLMKTGAVLFVANEIRGLILAAPVLYGIYEAGGTWVAIWVGFCSLAGIALSVIVPLYAAKRFFPGKLRTPKLA